MTIICEWCNRIIDVPDPPETEEVDIWEKLGRRLPHYICAECVRKVLDNSDA